MDYYVIWWPRELNAPQFKKTHANRQDRKKHFRGIILIGRLVIKGVSIMCPSVDCLVCVLTFCSVFLFTCVVNKYLFLPHLLHGMQSCFRRSFCCRENQQGLSIPHAQLCLYNHMSNDKICTFNILCFHVSKRKKKSGEICYSKYNKNVHFDLLIIQSIHKLEPHNNKTVPTEE